jgi:hypothetical protein
LDSATFAQPAFDAVRENLSALPSSAWPTLAELNCLAASRELTNHRGLPIRFVAPHDDEAAHYETRIADTGEVATRENWHDFFNAMQWLTFPKSKAMLSAKHADLLARRGDAEAKSRSVPRDVLTLFDEGGVVVASADESLLDGVRNFDWQRLFVERRADVIRNMRFFLCGHSVLEKMLDPFIGITAKALLLKVENDFRELPVPAQVRYVDARAAHWLGEVESFASTRVLHPLPILGIPGWDGRNAVATFYDNSHYFRPGYSRDKLGGKKPA